MMGNWQNFTAFGVGGFGIGGIAFLILIAWSLVWKGLALWKSAQRKEKWWFMVLLVVNTVGILEILYLYVFSKEKKNIEGPVV
ncbi:MAG: DUF5652 family protein [Candidatus Parcubacteria bacterium]|nr:DUF5652 family protein [Candidatus Parcubacteria bacterium]